MKKLLPVLVFLLVSIAQAGAWVGVDGKPAPEAKNRKSVNDFSAMLLVTPNGEWEKEWNTSPETVPMFKEVDKAKIGDVLAVLTTFANPKADKDNNVNVVCSLKVIRPNNTISVNQENIPCLQGKLLGPATNIKLSPAIIRFTAESTDPIGIWRVEATVEDRNRNTKIELETQYEFVGAGG